MIQRRAKRRAAVRLGWLPAIALSVGCLGPLARNAPLESYDPAGGYRFDALDPGEGNSDEVFIVVTFSGGGTRAASMAYGVLQGLRETVIGPLAPGGRQRRLLDEVDAISSVSGGSFPAAGYALWRDDLFSGEFERRFLKNDIQSMLWQLLWRPANFWRLPSVVLDRIDVAATYYDDEIFRQATYADLLSQSERPFTVINATNLSSGRRFEFTQDDFDLLGSDLASVSLGTAVAASSALPILLSPLRLTYYPGPVSSRVLDGILTNGHAPRHDARRHEWARDLIPPRNDGDEPPHVLDAGAHRYLYLVDGGLADNLGLIYVIRACQSGPIRRRIESGAIKRLVVIVVDAGVRPPQDMERLPAAPGMLRVGRKSAAVGVRNYSDALIENMRHLMVDMPRIRERATEPYRQALAAHCPDAPMPVPHPFDTMEQHLIILTLRDIENDAERARFQKMRTSLFLPDRDVDELIEKGRTLLKSHPEFKRLVQDLGGQP